MHWSGILNLSGYGWIGASDGSDPYEIPTFTATPVCPGQIRETDSNTIPSHMPMKSKLRIPPFDLQLLLDSKITARAATQRYNDAAAPLEGISSISVVQGPMAQSTNSVAIFSRKGGAQKTP